MTVFSYNIHVLIFKFIRKNYIILLYTSQNMLELIKRLMSSLMLQSMGMNLTFNRIQAQSDFFFAPCMYVFG